MKTKHISIEEMDKRVSKFKKLKPLSIQQDANIPIEGRDVVYARQLLSVIGLDPREGNTPINSGAPIIGAGGITMTHAKCPPGQGPGLHNHINTYETFTVLDGQFEISWNDDGSDTIILEKFDSLESDDVRSITMGDSGEDILLSPAARKLFPFSVECKNQEKLNIWSALDQAEQNSGEHTPLVIFKRNRSKIYAVLEIEKLLELLNE